jgi:hypothetical protein
MSADICGYRRKGYLHRQKAAKTGTPDQMTTSMVKNTNALTCGLTNDQ